jgi:hypothetical protein
MDVAKVDVGYGDKTFPLGVYGVKVHEWTAGEGNKASLPEEFVSFLESRDAVGIFEGFMVAVGGTEKSFFGTFVPKSITGVKKDFDSDFKRKNFKVIVCQRIEDFVGGSTVTHVWLEVIDLESASSYRAPEEYMDVTCSMC